MTVSENVREARPRTPSPVFLVGLLMAVIFSVEFGLMWHVPLLPPSWPHWVVSMLDAVILVSVLQPALYFLVFRPLLRSLKDRGKLHQGLLEAQGELERRIADRTAALEEANRRLQDGFAAQERHNREMSALSEMVNLFHACRTETEARAVISQHIPLLFSKSSGALFVFNSSRNLIETVATWGEGAPPEGFSPDECWALRRGRTHVAERDAPAGCRHLTSNAWALCVPMVAHSEVLGVLQLGAPAAEAFDEAARRLAQAAAESVALGLSNLHLRDKLRHLAVRDPLTDLFNRRYLEETLERELLRAGRKSSCVGVIAVDIDHFKRFNDTFGHEAGDFVIKELGQLFRAHVRGADIPCRQGGEEFLLVLPEADLEVTRTRAEQIRSAVQALSVSHRGQTLGAVSVSLGVAVFPEHGLTRDELLRAADAALYRAKQAGRNRDTLASAGRVDRAPPARHSPACPP